MAVSFSIGTLDRSVWKLTEPGTPPPDRRVEALRRLTDLGIPCGVLVAPVLPGLSDSEAQLTEVVEACAEAGAVSIDGVALHLRGTAARATTSTGWRGTARPGAPAPGALPARGLPGGRGARAGGGHRAGGGPALRRDGRDRYRGQRATVRPAAAGPGTERPRRRRAARRAAAPALSRARARRVAGRSL